MSHSMHSRSYSQSLDYAFELGAASYYNNHVCPYHPSEPSYNAWCAGYNDAHYRDHQPFEYVSEHHWGWNE